MRHVLGRLTVAMSSIGNDQTWLLTARPAWITSAPQVESHSKIQNDEIDGRNVSHTIQQMVPPSTQTPGPQAIYPLISPTQKHPTLQ
jgi:hypothetical protein